ncbi:MAG: ATP-binding protein [Marmoricola sp.]
MGQAEFMDGAAPLGELAPVRVTLPPLPESVRDARAFVRAALAGVARDRLVADAQLAISEVVTNAVVHAGTDVHVAVSAGVGAVRIAVTDGSHRAPRTRGYADTAGTGRGLRLLNELTTSWGVDSHEDGKTVWFELGPENSEGAEWPRPPETASLVDTVNVGAPGPADPVPATGSTVVRLLNAPVLLYAAWRQHAEALLREYFLLQLDRGHDEEAVRVHSEASDALALLDESIPPAPVTNTPSAALAAATGPDATATRVLVRVPAQVRPHFTTLNRTLEDAASLAEDHRLLTPGVQPEMLLLRRWLCSQVLTQCEGGRPRGWEPLQAVPSQGPSRSALPAAQCLGWDTTAVAGSTLMLLAADDTSTIIAVSPPVVNALGYATADQLVGRRLICVIPERFRQAHLAGFTFHLLTGQNALLDAPIVVPVLRRDHTEALVEMTVHEEHTDDGRPVFVAELVPADSAAASQS